jgi:uncharacterized membrane protein
MNKNRLEAFSDGILAIIITIMVLELKVPHNPTWKNYLDSYPVFASYALSFVFVGLYWSNHHHLFHTVSMVNNKVLWLNMFVLFWESLIPFVTATMGENHFSSITVTLYALVMTASTIAHVFLVNALCRLHGVGSEFSKAFKGHLKSYLTIGVNISAALLAFIGFPNLAFCVLVFMAVTWFLPNHHISNY